MKWFWYFFLYSLCGFILEVLFARATHAAKQDRKCFLLLPLCPVYGLGALGILAAASLLHRDPLLMALAGGGVATAAEYLMGLFYERVLGVAFWDYSHLPMNVGGEGMSSVYADLVCVGVGSSLCRSSVDKRPDGPNSGGSDPGSPYFYPYGWVDQPVSVKDHRTHRQPEMV